MGSYGFCFYGPYQHFWYGQLDKFFPTKSLAHFGSKVHMAPPSRLLGRGLVYGSIVMVKEILTWIVLHMFYRRLHSFSGYRCGAVVAETHLPQSQQRKPRTLVARASKASVLLPCRCCSTKLHWALW